MTTTTALSAAEKVRKLTTGVQYRDLLSGTQVRAADAEGTDRGVAGIAVPWDDPIEYWGIREEFAPGSCTVEEGNPPQLFWRHREVIGGLTGWADQDAGWHIDAAISDTTQGRDAHTLAKDGHVRKFSIGFTPVEWEERHEEDGTIVLRYTKVLVREVSLVPHPAYGNASVESVRQDPTATPIVTSVREAQPTPQQEDTMSGTTLTRADLDEVRSSIEDLDRELKLVAAQGTQGRDEGHADRYRSVGELLKRLAAGDEQAKRDYDEAFSERAFEGSTSADTILRDGWVGSLVEVIKKRRPVLSTFATGSLPAEGMTVEYGVLEEDTTQVGVQAAEGDPLLYGKVSIGTRNAPVVTLGGWSELSRQAIERSSVGVLDVMWEALAEKYGQASEVYARARLDAAIAASGGAALATVEADLTTQDGIVAGVLDLAEHFDNVGRALDGVFVDKATFLALYSVPATDRVLQVSGAPADKVGTITVQTAQGNVAGLEFKLLPNAAASTVVAYDQTAMRTLEAPGAPFRLQDGNIVNLTQAYSLYGYLASYVQKPAGLVKVTAPAAG